VSVRPEKIKVCLEPPAAPVNVLTGRVDDVGYLGSISHYHVQTDAGRVTALRANASHSVERPISWDDTVWLEWPVEAGVVLKA
jgi:putrescine transport system ATP-binding protein